MPEEDMSKMACLVFVGIFKWVLMTLGLKNACVIHQRALNLTFHDLIGVIMEVYFLICVFIHIHYYIESIPCDHFCFS